MIISVELSSGQRAATDIALLTREQVSRFIKNTHQLYAMFMCQIHS